MADGTEQSTHATFMRLGEKLSERISVNVVANWNAFGLRWLTIIACVECPSVRGELIFENDHRLRPNQFAVIFDQLKKTT